MQIALYKEMVKVADLYTDTERQDTYHKAAARFRLPYWDPIMPRNERDGDPDTVFGIPVIFQQKEVFVRTPSDPENLRPMPNPFYDFAFPSESEWRAHPKRPKINFGTAYNKQRTVRTPDAKGQPV